MLPPGECIADIIPIEAQDSLIFCSLQTVQPLFRVDIASAHMFG